MPRLVTKTAKGPLKVGEKNICMCGLSGSQPFCDKSHLMTLDEADGKLYWYQDGKREEVIQEDDSCSGHCNDSGCEECKGEGCGCSDKHCKCENEDSCKDGCGEGCDGGCCEECGQEETEE